jgi:hypothetical protein
MQYELLAILQHLIDDVLILTSLLAEDKLALSNNQIDIIDQNNAKRISIQTDIAQLTASLSNYPEFFTSEGIIYHQIALYASGATAELQAKILESLLLLKKLIQEYANNATVNRSVIAANLRRFRELVPILTQDESTVMGKIYDESGTLV